MAAKLISAIPKVYLDVRIISKKESEIGIGKENTARRPQKGKEDVIRHPLKISVSFQGTRRYYVLGIYLSKSEFERLEQGNLPAHFRKIKDEITAKQSLANIIINSLNPFTFTEFEKQFFGEKKTESDAYSLIEEQIKFLESKNRIGYADNFKNTLSSLRKFKKSLACEEITKEFLEDYESWMLEKGNSMTTIGMYLRALRTIVNQAIENGILKVEAYPFSKKRYQIPTGENIKKSLTVAQIEIIYKYETIPFSSKEKAKDTWLFCYLSNGMNITDFCNLKWKDLSDNRIVFLRKKTINSKKAKPKPIVCTVNSEIIRIIKKWGNTLKNPDDYIFDVIKPEMNAKDQKAKIRQFIKTTNHWMKKIGKELEIDKPITTYAARHSFSNILKESGVAIELISESLGHSDIRVTEHYLDSFEDSHRNKYFTKLAPFLEEHKQ